MRNPVRLFWFVCLLSGCQDPRAILDKAIQDKHFIPFQLPMPSTRVGTILRGSDKEMYLVARPERCFPDLPDPRGLRWLQATDLPNEYRTIQFGFTANANAILGSGSQSITLKMSASYVKTVQLEFVGATVEFLDEMSFADYLANGMPSECKRALAEYPFIGQGLRIESMKFIFKDVADGNIDLTAKLSEIVDIEAGVNWHLENSYTLVIETPKYIGYRMAKVDAASGALLYATTIDQKGNWIFRAVSARANAATLPRPAERIEPIR
jgi:hypothetical protein